jgi:hypothetical protein
VTTQGCHDSKNTAQPVQDWSEGIWPQMQCMGDTKAGTWIAKDRYGNKYFENLEGELPLRTRWVDYKDKELDLLQLEPGLHRFHTWSPATY